MSRVQNAIASAQPAPQNSASPRAKPAVAGMPHNGPQVSLSTRNADDTQLIPTRKYPAPKNQPAAKAAMIGRLRRAAASSSQTSATIAATNAGAN